MKNFHFYLARSFRLARKIGYTKPAFTVVDQNELERD